MSWNKQLNVCTFRLTTDVAVPNKFTRSYDGRVFKSIKNFNNHLQTGKIFLCENEDNESNDHSIKTESIYNTPFYRDTHVLRALEIQEKARER